MRIYYNMEVFMNILGKMRKILFPASVIIVLTLWISSCGGSSSKKDSAASPSAAASTSSGLTYTIYSIGDSTMSDYDTAVYTGSTERRGWCQMFPQFITSSTVNLVNAAKAGRGSRSYYLDTAGYWTAVKAKIKSGDYVLIQFGHNDEIYDGLSNEEYYSTETADTAIAHDFGRGTEATLQYKEYLGKYISETRALGATPILVTPIVRCYWDSTSTPTITAKGAHNLTGLGTVPGSLTTCTSADYVSAMKEVGDSYNCPVIDMTSSTKSCVESYATSLGSTSSARNLIYNVADTTHLTAMGAMMYAQLAVKELLAKSIFTGDLTSSTSIMTSPSVYDFSSHYIATSTDKIFTLTGLTLSPAAGNITVATSSDGFSVCSTATGTFSSSFTIPYSGGQLSPTNFYVRFAPTAAGSYSGTITVTPESGTSKTITVSGIAIEASSGASTSSAVYSLTSAETATVTGTITADDETLSNLVSSYTNASAYTWGTASADTYIQRVAPTSAGAWTSAIDVNSAQYVQFSVAPVSGKTFIVDTISMYIGGAGGSAMCYNIQYSTNSDFSSSTVLGTGSALAKNTMNKVSFSSVITVNSGQKLYIRVYPWYTSTATGKFLCLQNVTVSGIAQ